jgi:hypothetical protein
MKSLRPSPPCCFKQLGEGASSYEPHQQALGKRRFQRWPAGRWGGLLPLRSALLKTARGAFLFHFRDVASGSTGGSIGCDDVATASRHCSSALTGFVTALGVAATRVGAVSSRVAATDERSTTFLARLTRDALRRSVRSSASRCTRSSTGSIVEGPALAGVSGAALRNLGRDHRCDRPRHDLLERASPSLHMGQTPPPSAPPLTRHCPPAEDRMTYRMHH